jgi:hypothetical protein
MFKSFFSSVSSSRSAPPPRRAKPKPASHPIPSTSNGVPSTSNEIKTVTSTTPVVTNPSVPTSTIPSVTTVSLLTNGGPRESKDSIRPVLESKEPLVGALFTFDFDKTISGEHMHNAMCDAGVDSRSDEDQWNLCAKNIEPRGSAAEWKTLFEKLIADGHQVAILSFNDFPRMVQRYLREKIGLSEETLGKMFLNCWLPDDENIGKNQHIDQAVAHFQRDKADRNIILVEDSTDNLRIATAAGKLHANGAVIAPTGPQDEDPKNPEAYLTAPHIAQVTRLSEQFKNEIAATRAAMTVPAPEAEAAVTAGPSR